MLTPISFSGLTRLNISPTFSDGMPPALPRREAGGEPERGDFNCAISPLIFSPVGDGGEEETIMRTLKLRAAGGSAAPISLPRFHFRLLLWRAGLIVAQTSSKWFRNRINAARVNGPGGQQLAGPAKN